MNSDAWRNNDQHYGSISRLLHWLMALLIVVMLALGWSLDEVPKGWRLTTLGIHKSLGIAVLLLALLRLSWRLYHKPPSFLPSMPAWEKKAALIGCRPRGGPLFFWGLSRSPAWYRKIATLADSWRNGMVIWPGCLPR